MVTIKLFFNKYENWPALAVKIAKTIRTRALCFLVASLLLLGVIIGADIIVQRKREARMQTLSWFLKIIPEDIKASDPKMKRILRLL